MTANNLTKKTLEYLTANGFFVWRQNTLPVYDKKIGGYRKMATIAGISDIIGLCPNGKFLAIEVKTENDSLRKSQIEFMHNVTNHNGFFIELRDFDVIVEFVKHYRLIEQADELNFE